MSHPYTSHSLTKNCTIESNKLGTLKLAVLFATKINFDHKINGDQAMRFSDNKITTALLNSLDSIVLRDSFIIKQIMLKSTGIVASEDIDVYTTPSRAHWTSTTLPYSNRVTSLH